MLPLLQFLRPADNLCSSCRHIATILTRYHPAKCKLSKTYFPFFVTYISSDFSLKCCWCASSTNYVEHLFFCNLVFLVWQNRHLGHWTLHKGSTSSLNFQNGQFSPSTFVFGQTRPYTNMWLHMGMKLIQKVHFALGSLLSSISPLEFQ
jgi:hypothetical protein